MKKDDKTLIGFLISICIACISFIVISILNRQTDITVASIGFIGSIFGGLIGGLFTLMGVRRTIDLQISKEEFDRLPGKLLNLDKTTEKYFKIMEYLNVMKGNISNIRTAKELRHQLKGFSSRLEEMNRELKYTAINVNGDIFRVISHVVPEDGMSDLIRYINVYEDKSNIKEILKTFNGSEEIGEKEEYLRSRAYVVFRFEYEEILEIFDMENIPFEWVRNKIIGELDTFYDRLEDNHEILFDYTKIYQNQLK